MCPAVWFKAHGQHTISMQGWLIALLSKADSVHHQTSLQPKPQGGESKLTLTTRGSLHAVFAQMCMITQLWLKKRGE